MARGTPAARGPLWAAIVAAAAGLPSLGLPFLSDDWSHAIAARDGTILTTPFNYFRPLCSLSYWIDWQVWGLTPAAFRVTGIVLAALAAALVVILVRRYSGDAALAATAGIVFAIHPYHVGAIGWIAARSDLLAAVLTLSAAWCFDRWARETRALPVATIVLYALALLAKEGAVVLPAFLLLVALFDRGRRIRGTAWLRAFAPLLLVGLAHFVVLRPAALGSVELSPLRWIGGWRGNLLSYGAASVLPLPPEVFQARLWLVGGAAAAIAVALLVVARLREGRIPAVVWPAGLAFAILLGPSLIGFVQRYYFLPSAAAALALAALLRAAGRRVGGSIAVALALVWIGTAVAGWIAWYDAAASSDRLIAGLVESSREADARTLVIAGSPHRVHGVPVTAAFDRIVPLLGGREVAILTVAEFDFPEPGDDAVVERRTDATGTHELTLEVAPAPYSRYVWPRVDAGATRVLDDGLSLRRESASRFIVRIEPRDGLRAFVWSGGELVALANE